MMHNTWSKGAELRLKYEDVPLRNEGTEVIDHDSYRLDHKLGDSFNKSGTWVVITQKMKTVMRKGTHIIILIYLSIFTTKSTWNFDSRRSRSRIWKAFWNSLIWSKKPRLYLKMRPLSAQVEISVKKVKYFVWKPTWFIFCCEKKSCFLSFIPTTV